MADTLFPSLENTATFSACGRYRWSLTRTWDATRPALVFLMLNPSTADAQTNDPTVTRCVFRARALGYGGLIVLNLFAWRATDPFALPDDEAAAVGSENDEWLRNATAGRDVVCAWGFHGGRFDRGRKVAVDLQKRGVTLYCLGLTKEGHPKHPLYIPADQALQVFTPSAGVANA